VWREICSLFAGNGIKKYAGSDLAFGQGNGVTMLLTAYEEKALENFSTSSRWCSVSEIGNCRLSTLNKLVEKGYLERIRRPGPYVPNESILFRMKENALVVNA
jgi:hypothetical protein